MQIKNIIEKLINKENLSQEEMQWAMEQLMQGQCNDIEIAAFLVALRCKEETVTELTAAAHVMRSLSNKLDIKKEHLIDIVGTGGDHLQTFNISTACCFIVAAAGGTIAKHGNRSASSKSGAADVLEQAGLNLDAPFEKVVAAINKLNIGFMFAPKHHLAMKHVLLVRKTLNIRTIFNLLGPLTNPANACYHLIGVYDKKWLQPFAEVLKIFGSKKALIIHGEDGLDEITLVGKTFVTELNQEKIFSYEIFPEQFGIKRQSLDSLKVNDSVESLNIIKSVFRGEASSAFDIVCLNAAAALYAAELSNSIEDGLNISHDLLKSGKVAALFHRFIKFF